MIKWIAILILLIPCFYSVCFATEYVSNGNMETGNPPTGWSIYYDCSCIIGRGIVKHGGSYSSVVIADETTGKLGIQQTLTGLTVGRSYAISVWLYTDTTENHYIKLGASSYSFTPSATESWINITTNLTALVTNPLLAIYGGEWSIFIDDVSVSYTESSGGSITLGGPGIVTLGGSGTITITP